MKQNYLKNLLFTFSLIIGISFSWAQTETFDYTGGLQTYTVPVDASLIQIEVRGAQGGNDGGLGAIMIGAFELTPGEELTILVGEQGGMNSVNQVGGGGGSFVVNAADEPLVIAGGGGGLAWNGSGSYDWVGIDANTTTNGNNGNSEPCGYGGRHGVGGVDGNGSTISGPLGHGHAGNGGGFYTNGSGGLCGGNGSSFLAGGAGGTGCSGGPGGYGGGANGGNWGGGGGGGYSGGGGAYHGPTNGGGRWLFNAGDDQDNSVGNTGHAQVVITVLCTPLTLELDETGVCLGDEITLDVSSETGGTISWSGGVFNGTPFVPAPGSTIYYATSTSPDDCPYSVEVTASPVPDIMAFSSLPAACEGALITVWGEGGDTYVWTGSEGFDPTDNVPFLAEDGVVTYTLDGSYLGCHADPIDITLVGSPQPEVIGVATPSELCMGDSYTVTGTGSGAESYYWGGGISDGATITPESAGTFIHMVVGVSDAGCYDTAFATVVVLPSPMIDAGFDVTVCEGNEVTLTATGTESYAWTPSITNGVAFIPEDLGLTVYTVIGTDANGCTDEENVNVTVLDKPVIESVTIVDEFEVNNGSIDITVSGGSGEYTYEWSNGAFTEDIYGLSSGLYSVVINDITIVKGMCPTDGGYTIKSYLGVESEDEISMLVYPNPTTDMITVMVEGQFNYELTNLLGDVILTGTAFNQEELSLNNLANGTYLVKVTSGDKINVIQIVKN